MKKKCPNIILVMSGGTGTRFGADCPKQYCTFNNRMIIDYVIDACRKTRNVDNIVIVAAEDYVGFIRDRYGLETVCGGDSRPASVANGIQYIHANYDCDKLIITNAVCPLATSEQYDKYFDYLDKYDFVLTTWKLAPALHRFDGIRVDRDDYFNVMEPDAYRFKELYDSYDFKKMNKYIFHNMPESANGLYCFDYPYTMKLTYPHDLKLLQVLYDEIITVPEREKTLQTVNNYLSADGTPGIYKWILNVQKIIQEMAHKYSILSYSINSQTEANIVYEAQSSKYGDIIIKFTPSKFHFHKEVTYYKLSHPGIMADLLDYDEDYNVLILKMVKPGIQVKFDGENKELRSFFDNVNQYMIPMNSLGNDRSVPDIMGEFDEYVEAADGYTYEYQFRKDVEVVARKVWKIYFEAAPKYYLHRDLHKRNILMCQESGIRAIDPRGAIGPKEFEYVIQFVIELRDYPGLLNRQLYLEMMRYFEKYVGHEELLAALYIFFIYKMNDYVFQKKDNNRLAEWCKRCIIDIYYSGNDNADIQHVVPNGLKRLEL